MLKYHVQVANFYREGKERVPNLEFASKQTLYSHSAVPCFVYHAYTHILELFKAQIYMLKQKLFKFICEKTFFRVFSIAGRIIATNQR